MRSQAKTVAEYLAELSPDRRETLQAVRAVMLRSLPKGYEEGMQYGMIGYFVPHRLYPAGYHCDPRQPLPFAGLASQKNHMTLSLMGVYSNPEAVAALQKAWADTGRKLDMGKACIRFRKLDDLPLSVITATVKKFTVKKFIEHYESAVLAMNRRAATARSTSRTTAGPSARSAASKTKRGRRSAPAAVKKQGPARRKTSPA